MSSVAPYLNRDAWLERRMPLIGSSDVGCVLGVDEYRTPAKLYDRIVLGEREELDNADIRRGNKQEDIAAAAVAEHLGLTLTQVRRHPMRVHAQHPFLVTDVDRMIVTLQDWPPALASMMEPQMGPGALEVKCPRIGTFYRYRDEGLPLRYVLQHQMHFSVTGWRWGVFAFYTPEYDDVIAFPVLRDEEFISMMVPRLVNWWDTHVVARVRPERPASPPARWPKKPKGEAAFRDDPLWEAGAAQYIDSTAESERARMNLEAAESHLVALLAPTDTNVAGCGVKLIRYSSTPRRQWDGEKFRAAVRQAQQEEDTDTLLTINPADEDFYYMTASKEKVEVKITKPTTPELVGEEVPV